MIRRQAGAALLFFTSGALMGLNTLSLLTDGPRTLAPAPYSVLFVLGSALGTLSAIALGVGVLSGKIGTPDESLSTTGTVVLLVLAVIGFGIGVVVVIF